MCELFEGPFAISYTKDSYLTGKEEKSFHFLSRIIIVDLTHEVSWSLVS